MKKKIIFLLCLLLVLCTSINTFVSAQVSNHTSLEYQNDKGEDVSVIIEDQSIKVTKQEIDEILCDYPYAECITIYEVGYITETVTPEARVWDPPLLNSDKYETEKTITVPERVIDDKFVISVARGENISLSSSWSSTLTSSISGSYFDKANLNIEASITASYSESYSFSGPPEESRSNSREYRVKFYQKDGTYIQRHYVYYWPSGDLYGIQSKSGTYTLPTKYLKYSIDRKI